MKKNEEKEVKKEKVVDTTVSEIVTLNNKIKELEEKVLYKDAELLNYKKRKDLEVSSMLKYANSDIILEMLSIVDDLERAIKLDDNILDDEVSKFLSGIKIIYSRLISILEKYEVKEIDALNKEFDPTYHQAVLTEKREDLEPGTVIEVMQKGYLLKDKVIRPAMVRVSE